MDPYCSAQLWGARLCLGDTDLSSVQRNRRPGSELWVREGTKSKYLSKAQRDLDQVRVKGQDGAGEDLGSKSREKAGVEGLQPERGEGGTEILQRMGEEEVVFIP
jgi:hypothetical protein